MTYNVHIEVPSGGISKGYSAATEERAVEIFENLAAQLKEMKFNADVVMTDCEIEIRREQIS